jgi:hypothetical protein
MGLKWVLFCEVATKWSLHTATNLIFICGKPEREQVVNGGSIAQYFWGKLQGGALKVWNPTRNEKHVWCMQIGHTVGQRALPKFEIKQKVAEN